MKIRIRGQSLRLRLGQSEVASLALGHSIEEAIAFGPAARFACVIRPDATADTIGVTGDNNRVVVSVPAGDLVDWNDSDAVGLAADLDAGRGVSLRVLIEKDFVCIDGPLDESQADAFPNPSVTC